LNNKLSIDYQIIRSARRKTIALQIKKNNVIVRAPNGVSHEYIQSLVNQKSQWILTKLATQQLSAPSNKPTYLPNSQLLIAGVEKKIVVSFTKKVQINTPTINENEIHINLPLYIQERTSDEQYLSAQIKKRLSSWMKVQAETYLSFRLFELSKQLNIYPSSYIVKRYKSRWGSCNNKHELSFNYLLTMSPNWVFDYVIIHELCHIKHLNHSAKFWALVESHMPNYKSATQWLKSNQDKICY
jgi:predicted metal-dependent hydrolase